MGGAPLWLSPDPSRVDSHHQPQPGNLFGSMKNLPIRLSVVRWLAAFALCLGIVHAAGEPTPLSKAELSKVEAVLTKNLKGKPTLQGGTKQQVDGGWKINCVASVGSGGTFEFVVMTELTMTLGYIDNQKPKVEEAAAKPAAKDGKS
jgi:hypothetical protein